MAKATFGAGCFWGVEYFFREVQGVNDAICGYMGGDDSAITYQEVKSGITGHAEVVEVDYDPELVSYEQLLNVFWTNHNPTTLNRQGEDEGSQYRSAIFYHSCEQQQSAIQSKSALQSSGKWGDKRIVTEIAAATKFNKAEEYHQSYLQKNNLPSCHISF
ncbi:peptide-methionine (S)-S-oxide reductase MsrA [Shewanella gelidii]|uniref:Peptide methionine sulfoxide reductase MsrA n=1 Tax=Shewanella gelidii TaxID=1642821 RepID=A0A917JVS5_9GAMM|nr:peptide-methionine (S)-S-oxide reductase MsrA [Shewanella gelidii]MCL1099057.1 peptide-methionine (S)-S-oxide reductase MsrA [Shewanella gelidii]GGI88506.1 peptide methionine sulfoxide reductase MsrA [Shewanella gelidii]